MGWLHSARLVVANLAVAVGGWLFEDAVVVVPDASVSVFFSLGNDCATEGPYSLFGSIFRLCG